MIMDGVGRIDECGWMYEWIIPKVVVAGWEGSIACIVGDNF